MIAPLRDYEPEFEPAHPALASARQVIAATLLPPRRRVPGPTIWPEWRAWMALGVVALTTLAYAGALWRRYR
jgi:hypothetical protein